MPPPRRGNGRGRNVSSPGGEKRGRPFVEVLPVLPRPMPRRLVLAACFDPVAYHTEGRPVPGQPAFTQ